MCSSQLGWHSLLLRHYVHDKDAEEFEIPPVPDQTVALVTRGATRLEVYMRGAWRQSNHACGNIVMSRPVRPEHSDGTALSTTRRYIFTFHPLRSALRWTTCATQDQGSRRFRRASRAPTLSSRRL